MANSHLHPIVEISSARSRGLNLLFERIVEVPRIRHDGKQTVDTLIIEEAYLFAKFLRRERETWVPRIPSLA